MENEGSGVRKMELQLEKAKEVAIPEDLTRLIVKKLPAKAAGRLCAVSTNWLGIVSQITLSQVENAAGNVLFTAARESRRWFYWFAHEKVLTDDDGLGAKYSEFVEDANCYSTHPICGLIVCYNGSDLLVCNPSLRKFLNLPTIPISGFPICFFGFDPIDAHFKVLTVSDEEPGKVMILTLVEGSTWRAIECNHLHVPDFDILHPSRAGIFLDGVVYYGASLTASPKQHVLMRFDMHSETFTLAPFPEETKSHFQTHVGYDLIKFQVKLALVPYPIHYPIMYGVFDLWVLDDFNSHTWSKQHFEIDDWSLRVIWRHDDKDISELYHCKGTLPTGELIFSPDRLVGGAVELLSYNMEDDILSKVIIQGVASEDDDLQVETYLDYIEEPLLLPGGTNDFYRKEKNMSSSRD